MPRSAAIRLRPAAITWSVPVDRFEIINGPSRSRILDAEEFLYRFHFVNLDFTLRTKASKLAFRRTLQVARMSDASEKTLNFTATFAGKAVSGTYNLGNRSGWFSLD